MRISAASGDDTVTYDVSSGSDQIFIDGGTGPDSLTINAGNRPDFSVLDAPGRAICQQGIGGSGVTVRDVEPGSVLGAASAWVL